MGGSERREERRRKERGEGGRGKDRVEDRGEALIEERIEEKS